MAGRWRRRLHGPCGAATKSKGTPMSGNGGEAWWTLQVAWRPVYRAEDIGGQGKVGRQSPPLEAASTG